MKQNDIVTFCAESFQRAQSSRKPKIDPKYLRNFAEAYAAMEGEITSLSLRKLKELLKKLPNYTATNCWWAEYEVAPLVFMIANKEVSKRSSPAFKKAVRRQKRLEKKQA